MYSEHMHSDNTQPSLLSIGCKYVWPYNSNPWPAKKNNTRSIKKKEKEIKQAMIYIPALILRFMCCVIYAYWFVLLSKKRLKTCYRLWLNSYRICEHKIESWLAEMFTQSYNFCNKV